MDETRRGKFHVRVLLKDVFGYPEYQTTVQIDQTNFFYGKNF